MFPSVKFARHLSSNFAHTQNCLSFGRVEELGIDLIGLNGILNLGLNHAPKSLQAPTMADGVRVHSTHASKIRLFQKCRIKATVIPNQG